MSFFQWFRGTPKPVFKPVGRLSDIWIHPVKSCRGYQVSSAECTSSGLSDNGLFDRHFVVLNEADRFVTMRQEPTLALIQPGISEDGLHLLLNAPGMDPVSISLADVTGSEKRIMDFRVWSMDTAGLYCGQATATWLSAYLQKPGHKMFYFKPGLTKPREMVAHSKWGGKFTPKEKLFGYQDEGQFMMLTEASLDDLNTHLEKPVTMRNFRPNLVVTGASAFDEDKWKYVRIGDTVTMHKTHGCGRCRLPTVDPETGVFNSDGQPLAALKQYRLMDKADPDSKAMGVSPVFGAMLLCDESGTIQVGDTVYAAE